MTDNHTPIIVFSYNRPAHILRLLTSLERCTNISFNRVHIFCDGAKSKTDQKEVIASRKVVQDWSRRLGANVTERDENLGLANSIVSVVGEFCDQYGQVIVLEDDLVVSPDFVQFMDQALTKYRLNENVFQISGYNFPTTRKFASDSFFLPLTTSWGWATWKRAWDNYTQDVDGSFNSMEELQNFDLQGAFPFSEILKSAIEDKVDSWGIYWRLVVFRANGLVLYPSRSLVWQGGFDGTGIHCDNLYKSKISNPPLSFRYQRLSKEIIWPETIKESSINLNQIQEHLRNRNNNKHWVCEKDSLMTYIKTLFEKVFIHSK